MEDNTFVEGLPFTREEFASMLDENKLHNIGSQEYNEIASQSIYNSLNEDDHNMKNFIAGQQIQQQLVSQQQQHRPNKLQIMQKHQQQQLYEEHHQQQHQQEQQPQQQQHYQQITLQQLQHQQQIQNSNKSVTLSGGKKFFISATHNSMAVMKQNSSMNTIDHQYSNNLGYNKPNYGLSTTSSSLVTTNGNSCDLPFVNVVGVSGVEDGGGGVVGDGDGDGDGGGGGGGSERCSSSRSGGDSGRYSSTPPELLEAVPPTAILPERFPSFNSGNMVMRIHQEVNLVNIPLSQLSFPGISPGTIYTNNFPSCNIPSTSLSSMAMTSNTIPSTSIPSNTFGPNNYQPSIQPTTSDTYDNALYDLGPISPKTSEVIELISDMTSSPEEVSKATLEVNENRYGGSPIIETKFQPTSTMPAEISTIMPVEAKFRPPSAAGQAKQAEKMILDVLEEEYDLPRSSSFDVSTLTQWHGPYNFDIKMPTDVKNKAKWCYSSVQNRVYSFPYIAMEMQVHLSQWLMPGTASVRMFLVYMDAQHRTVPVLRCHNCMNADKTSGENVAHLLQANNSLAVHGKTGLRDSVTVPLSSPHPGENYVTMLVKFTCMTSCLGGPNRRPFAIIFSLIVNGEEKGRRMLETKCCKAPSRDMKKEEAEFHGLPVDNKPTKTEMSSPKKRLSGTKVKQHSGTKRLVGTKACLTTNSDSETEEKSNYVNTKKVKINNKIMKGLTDYTIAMSPCLLPGYRNLVVPEQQYPEMARYLRTLLCEEHVKNTNPQLYNQLLPRSTT